MIFTVTLNPAVDKVMVINDFRIGSVNRSSRVIIEAGGKGINVSKTIQSLGGESKTLGILAGQSGSFIEKALVENRIHNEFVYVEGETRTNVKISDPINSLITDINEPGPIVSQEAIDELGRRLFHSIKEGDILVLTGSTPQGVEKDIYKKWIERAKQRGACCILDADGELLKQGVQAGPYLIKPNIHELQKLLGVKGENLNEIVEAAERLLVNGTEIVVVSCGEKGSVFVSKNRTAIVDGIEIAVKSTVGAGDAMVAALSYGIQNKLESEEIIRLAAACGTATAMSYGNQPAIEDVESISQRVKIRYIYR